MRVVQLLAIAALCPLGAASTGCKPILQPLGEYESGQHAPRKVPGDADSTKSDGLAPTSTDASANDFPIVDGGPDAAQLADASNPMLAPPHTPTWLIGSPLPPSDRPDAAVPRIERCVTTLSMPAERKRLDMYIVMDANVTLPYTGQWELATAGLRAFVLDSRTRGIGVGLRFFGNQCDADVYSAQPNVEVDLVENTAASIVSWTNMRLNYPASPMGPALIGGIQHQTRRAAEHPAWKQVVVLVSDGFTADFTCQYSSRDLDNDAAAGFSQSPPIETHVIGFGLPPTGAIAGDIVSRFLPLDSIAAAGGSRQSVSVSSNDDASKMNEAFQSVRRNAQPCEYVLPSGLDPTAINLTLTPGGDLPLVDDATRCGQTAGFYYDSHDAPTSMILCPASCTAMQQSDSQTAVLLVGCPSRRR
jgi:hypothetical protein